MYIDKAEHHLEKSKWFFVLCAVCSEGYDIIASINESKWIA